VLEQSREDLRQGAVFGDPDGRFDGVVWFLEGEIRDGANAIAGKRLFALYQPTGGGSRIEAQPMSPAVLWDLVPVHGEGTRRPDDAPAPDGAIVEAAVSQVLAPYQQELMERRQRDADIKRRYGLRSLEQRILESEAKLMDYDLRRASGQDIPEPTIQNEERVKEGLEERKRELELAIQRETTLAPATPRILGAARVAPEAAASYEMRCDPEVEAIAMQEAMAHERQQGRRPLDVSRENLGYDIRSEEGARQDGEAPVRYIEVKGRAHSGPIAITPNEWLMAHRLEADYWLYVVENCRSEPRLYTIPNPAATVSAQERIEVVRYVVHDWKEAAESAEKGEEWGNGPSSVRKQDDA